MSPDNLKKFLLKANMPHAAGTANMRNESNGSRTILFEDGDWSMEDNFYGGEPYGGQQVVFYKGKPYWICVYYGQVSDTSLTPDEVYGFLREALQYPPEDRPFRGPDSYKKGNLEYKNSLEGEANNYSGKEVILENEKEIYWAKYMGGLVDQRFQDSL
jgi:hypothetical protein